MVQTEISQLGMESRGWIEHLRRERTEVGGLRERLQSVVEGAVERDSLPQVEHYENQIDIQLSNINHLKHSIKEHEKQLAAVAKEQGEIAAQLQTLSRGPVV